MKDTNLNVRISSELLNKAKEQAREDNRTLSNYVITLIKNDLKKVGKEMNEFKSKGYVEIKTNAGTIVKERAYEINGVDAVCLDVKTTAGGDVYKFFDLRDVEKNDEGFYTKSTKNAIYEAKGLGLKKFENFNYSISDDELEYKA